MRPETIPTNRPADAATDRDRRLAGLRSALRERAADLCATLEFLNGEAELFDPSTGRTRAAEAGIRLARGQRLSLVKGRALVRMNDGSDLWLADGASLDLSPWGEAARSVRLAGGKMLAIVAREAGRVFQTLTAAGSIRVTGTAFEADASSPGRLNVAVLHGGVEVSTGFGMRTVRRGFASSATADAAPEAPRRWKPSANDGWSWSAELAASSNNARVRPAYNAVAKSTGLPPARISESATNTMNATAFRALLVVAAIAILGGGAWILAQEDNATPPATVTEKITLPDGTQATWNRQVGGPSGVKFAFKDANGNESEFDAADPASVDKILQQLPADKRDKIRDILAKELAKWSGKPGQHAITLGVVGDKVMLSVSAENSGDEDNLPPGTDGIRRDVDSGSEMLQALVANGMPVEEARKVVEAAIADSVTKRVKAEHGDDAKVFVQSSMNPGANGEGGQNSMMVFVQKDDGETSEDSENQVHVQMDGK